MKDKAEKFYLESLNLRLVEDRLFHWIKRIGDTRWQEQVSWLEKGIERWPHQLPLKFQLAQTLEKQSQNKI